jgi:hypothetical protein
VHSDVAGPMRTPSLGGARYFVLFIDDYTRFTAVFTLKHKSEVFERFVEYKAWAENNQAGKIRALRSDNGGEYTSLRFSQLLKENGITHEKTVPYSPEQNGVSERANRTLIGRAKAMMLDHNLAEEMWVEAIRTAVYLKNQTPTSSIRKNTTPLQLWTGDKAVDLSHLIPFGTPAFRHVPKEKRTKWERNGERCTVVGYEGTNQYRVLIGRNIYVSRDIQIIKAQENTSKFPEEKIDISGAAGMNIEFESDEETPTDIAATIPVEVPEPVEQPEERN